MQFVTFWVNLNFRNTYCNAVTPISDLICALFLDLMQPCLWTEFILESPRKQVLWVLENPGIRSLQVLESPGKHFLLSVRTLIYAVAHKNYMAELRQILCACWLWPWLSPSDFSPLAMLSTSVCGWRHVFTQWVLWCMCVYVSDDSITASLLHHFQPDFTVRNYTLMVVYWWQSLLYTKFCIVRTVVLSASKACQLG